MTCYENIRKKKNNPIKDAETYMKVVDYLMFIDKTNT
jgi:hypothetical protein